VKYIRQRKRERERGKNPEKESNKLRKDLISHDSPPAQDA